MKKGIFLVFVFLLLSISLHSYQPDRKIGFHIEFDQMLSFKLGAEYRFNDAWGIRGGFGTGIPPGGTFTWNLKGYYRFTSPQNPWKVDAEIGMLQAYFNPIESSQEFAPFHGYLPGLSLRFGRQTKIGLFALRAGGGFWMEHQKESGWKGRRIMPVVALNYGFTYYD